MAHPSSDGHAERFRDDPPFPNRTRRVSLRRARRSRAQEAGASSKRRIAGRRGRQQAGSLSPAILSQGTKKGRWRRGKPFHQRHCPVRQPARRCWPANVKKCAGTPASRTIRARFDCIPDPSQTIASTGFNRSSASLRANPARCPSR